MPDYPCTTKCLITLIAFSCLCLHDAGVANEKITLGWIEKAGLVDYKLAIHAKIDSGARHSSLHASDTSVFDRGGKKWIKFTVKNRDGDTAVIESPVVRIAKIKTKGSQSQQRPVIMMKLCLANHMKEVEVNIVDRSAFNYQMLVGRSLIHGTYVIDVSKKYQHEPQCDK